MTRARLALLPDFPQEQWPSMDLVAEQLLLGLQQGHSQQFDVKRSCPRYVHPASRLLGKRSAANNMDRLFNRFVIYPRFARRIRRDFDLFHLCDHSYSQVIHSLPADRTGVFCHDLDTFRCLLQPALEPRPRWFRAMAKKILTGMQKAAIVFHATQSVRSQIEHYGLIDPSRLVHAPLGISAEFFERDPTESAPDPNSPILLHVGSCIPRKRIDVLLDVFADVKKEFPVAKLIQIGGDFTQPQRDQIARLDLENAITQTRGLSRSQLAGYYRKASLVLVTSEAEGFGLPAAEAIASGAAVLASDIPVLREVGGDAVLYAPVADVHAWAVVARKILENPSAAPEISRRALRASQFSWQHHAAVISAAYQSIRPVV
jgi:glycosyltransferase involved in cell wall biosynthesis